VLLATANGFYYILDRVTGEFLQGTQFATQTWAKGLDAQGRPIPDPSTARAVQGAKVYPDDDGAANCTALVQSTDGPVLPERSRAKARFTS